MSVDELGVEQYGTLPGKSALRRLVLILGMVCTLHGVILACLWSPAWFGFPHDDTLYVAAGKALAEGKADVLPGLPGEPAQTKYPPLYPALLAAFWLVSGDLGAVLANAFWLNWACSIAFLTGSFVLLQQLGLRRRSALAITAVAAVHPAVIGLNVLLLSDVPFMALTVWALVTAHRTVRDEGTGARISLRWAAVAGLLTLTVLVRSLGIAVVAGVAAYGWFSGRRTPAMSSAAVATTIFIAQTCWSWRHAAEVGSASGGLQRILLFYSSYARFWRLCVPDVSTLWALAGFNFREVLKEPAIECFLLPFSGFDGGLWQMAGVAVSAGVLKGLVGLARRHELHPAHCALAAYVPLVVLWNYPLAGRFLLVFLPLFLAGAFHEFVALTNGVVDVFRRPAPLVDRAVSAVLACAVAALPAYAAYRLGWWFPQSLSRAAKQRAALAAEDHEAMTWIRDNTDPSDRFISYQDSRLYLETGRQAIRPMAFRTSAFYLQEESILEIDLTGMAEVVAAVDARFWVRADDDFHLEVATERIGDAVDDLLARCPVVFKSSDGRVRIHEISSLRE